MGKDTEKIIGGGEYDIDMGEIDFKGKLEDLAGLVHQGVDKTKDYLGDKVRLVGDKVGDHVGNKIDYFGDKIDTFKERIADHFGDQASTVPPTVV